MAAGLSDFLALSSLLTGYDEAYLHGTGVAELYLDEVTAIVGEPFAAHLWALGRQVADWRGGDRTAEVSTRLLRDPDLGPVCANLIVLWYTGNWTQLPPAWRDEHGAGPLDSDRVISAEAYTAGLVWDAIGAHPQGAKAPGFGSWVSPPKVRHG